MSGFFFSVGRSYFTGNLTKMNYKKFKDSYLIETVIESEDRKGSRHMESQCKREAAYINTFPWNTILLLTLCVRKMRFASRPLTLSFGYTM